MCVEPCVSGSAPLAQLLTLWTLHSDPLLLCFCLTPGTFFRRYYTTEVGGLIHHVVRTLAGLNTAPGADEGAKKSGVQPTLESALALSGRGGGDLGGVAAAGLLLWPRDPRPPSPQRRRPGRP